MEGEAGRSTRDASQQNLDGGERNGGANHSNNGSAEGGFNSQDTGALDYYETGEDGGDGDWRQGIYDGGDNDDGGGSNEEMNNAIVNPSGGRSTVKSDLHQKQQRVRAISSESIERVVDAGLGSGGDVSNRNAKATMSSNKQRKGKSLTKMLAAGSQGSIGGSMGSLSRKSVNSVGSEQLGSQESMVSAGSSSNVYRSWGDFPRTK